MFFQVHFSTSRCTLLRVFFIVKSIYHLWNLLDEDNLQKFQNVWIFISSLIRDTGCYKLQNWFCLVWETRACCDTLNSSVKKQLRSYIRHLEIPHWEQQKKLQTASPGAAPWRGVWVHCNLGKYYLTEYHSHLCSQQARGLEHVCPGPVFRAKISRSCTEGL